MTHAAAETPAQAFVRCRDMDASLPERLAAFAIAARKFRPALQEAADHLIDRLRQHDAGESAPKPGEDMPAFLLPDESGRLVSLKDLLRHSPVAITFHRGHWCPFCRISTYALTQAQRQLGDSAKIIAIMPDRTEFVAEFKSASRGELPVLSDTDNGYAMTLNLAVWVGDEMQREMRAIGQDLGRFQGNDAWTVPIPATFVVARNGIVTARFIDPDFRTRVAIDDLIAALKQAI
jgi:peroxiredoxin